MAKRLIQQIGRYLLLIVLETTVVIAMMCFQILRGIVGFLRNPRLPHFSWKFSQKQKTYFASGAILAAMVAILVMVVGSFSASPPTPEKTWFASDLRIPEESHRYISDDSLFRAELVDMGHRLELNPSWILAVMFHESRLNPAALNFRGSGATGLIQFMGPALKDINQRLRTRYYLSDLRKMDAITQLRLVEEYYAMVQERYGKIQSFPDAYLAVLFPKAIGKGEHHVLFSRPGRRYSQNSGLDMNRDGQITVADISNRLYRMFPDLAEVGQSSLVSGK